jgi:hypothetical protein
MHVPSGALSIKCFFILLQTGIWLLRRAQGSTADGHDQVSSAALLHGYVRDKASMHSNKKYLGAWILCIQ